MASRNDSWSRMELHAWSERGPEKSSGQLPGPLTLSFIHHHDYDSPVMTETNEAGTFEAVATPSTVMFTSFLTMSELTNIEQLAGVMV